VPCVFPLTENLLQWSITKDGDDDDDEVKDVPWLSKVIPAQADELDDTLERENGNEDGIDVMQHVSQLLRLVVVFNGHGRHVEQNYQHYSDVKLLIRRQLEETQLTFQLQNSTFYETINYKTRVNVGAIVHCVPKKCMV